MGFHITIVRSSLGIVGASAPYPGNAGPWEMAIRKGQDWKLNTRRIKKEVKQIIIQMLRETLDRN